MARSWVSSLLFCLVFNPGVGCHFLLQGIFMTQGQNRRHLHLLHWQVGSLLLAPPGNSQLYLHACRRFKWRETHRIVPAPECQVSDYFIRKIFKNDKFHSDIKNEWESGEWAVLRSLKKSSVIFQMFYHKEQSFPGGTVVKNLLANAGDARDSGQISGSRRSLYLLWLGNGNPFQYSCLKNAMSREVWWATVHGVTKSQTRLSD